MGIISLPASAGGISSAIKSVQTGSAAAAGTVTITAVDINKAFVHVFGTASSGTVAVGGSINAINGNINSGGLNGGLVANIIFNQYGGRTSGNAGSMTVDAVNFAGNSANLTGGTTNLVAAVVQGYLSNSTSLVVSGACRWEVIEFN